MPYNELSLVLGSKRDPFYSLGKSRFYGKVFSGLLGGLWVSTDKTGSRFNTTILNWSISDKGGSPFFQVYLFIRKVNWSLNVILFN